ncbi:MAG: hypothetical protein H0U35_06480 [Sporichthyaceae bacterium]|nr:hypothetical protein [Sporichthyaceae bacterium]
MHRPLQRALGATAVLPLALAPAGAAQAHAAAPAVERTVTIERLDPDPWTFDVCGITTTTEVTERVTAQEWADGRRMVHVVVTYVSADPRVAIEKDSYTELISVDGTRTVVGLPIRLIDPQTGRIIIRDAGRITFGEDGVVAHGPHPYVEAADLAPFYCPGLT